MRLSVVRLSHQCCMQSALSTQQSVIHIHWISFSSYFQNSDDVSSKFELSATPDDSFQSGNKKLGCHAVLRRIWILQTQPYNWNCQSLSPVQCPHCRRKVRLSQKMARQRRDSRRIRRQSHFSATVLVDRLLQRSSHHHHNRIIRIMYRRKVPDYYK